MLQPNTPLFQLTVGEFQELLKNHVPDVVNPESDADAFVYGIGGLAWLLNCSNVTAQKLKNSGKIPFSQVGRKIIFNKAKVLAVLSDK